MRQLHIIVYSLCFTLSLFILSVVILYDSSKSGGYGMPPSRLPAIYAGTVAVAALALLIKYWRKGGIAPLTAPAAWRRTLLIQGAIALYALIFWFCGFIVAGMALLFVLQWIMGQRNRAVLLSFSLLPPPLLWLAATRLLGVALP